MKQFSKIYVEITNICNLECSFCPKTPRKLEFMTLDNFTKIAKDVKLHSDYIYLHVKGEPMLHPHFPDIMNTCQELNLKVCLTTNGTLLQKFNLNNFKSLHKLHISLHSFEANDLDITLNQYLQNIISVLASSSFITVLRLWNTNGLEELNEEILSKLDLKANFEIDKTKHTKIKDKVFLEYGEHFDWPDMASKNISQNGYCYGLKNQIGVLVCGTVIPCCLDNNGDINLGNIHKNSLEEIWTNEKSQRILKGFSERKLLEPLCKTCGFIKRFN